MANEKKPVGQAITTPKFRVSYPNLFKPRTSKDFPDKKPTFSIDMIFSKKADLSVLTKEVNRVKTEKWGPKEKWPKGLRSPFKDGDEKENEEYKGCFYATATSQRKVPVYDRDGTSEIVETDDSFYPGCFARAKVVIYTYEAKGNKGVALGLRGVQKWEDGEALGGGVSVKPGDFDSVEDQATAESSDEEVDLDSLV